MTNLADTLWTPTREQVVTTNAWAFLHWLEATRGLLLDGWDALHRYSASEPVAFRAAIAAFARLPETPSRILRHTGEREALVLRAADGSRQAFSRDALAASATGLPTDMATAIIRPWPRASLARALADLPRRPRAAGRQPILASAGDAAGGHDGDLLRRPPGQAAGRGG
jgi:hypothetical protein